MFALRLILPLLLVTALLLAAATLTTDPPASTDDPPAQEDPEPSKSDEAETTSPAEDTTEPPKVDPEHTEPPTSQPDPTPRESVTITGHIFNLELATDEASRAKGLSGREAIDPHQGMLFVYPRSRLRSFWMKDCLVDIDIIFLDPRGRIVAMHEMLKEPPKRETESQARYEARLKNYSSRRPAQFAIELKSGWLDTLDLRIGDTITLDLKRLKQLARPDRPAPTR